MNHLRVVPILVLLSLVVGSARAAGGRGAAGTVRDFYGLHFRHDMAFTEKSVRRKAEFLAPEVLAACLAYLARPVPTDEVPAIDGDPFTDSQDYPTGFRIGRTLTEDTATRVPITLVWQREQRELVALVAIIDGEWRITDLEYPEGGTLRGLLATPD